MMSATPTSTLLITHLSQSSIPITTTFTANPRQEYDASTSLRWWLRSNGEASLSVLRSNLQALQTPTWYLELDSDVRQYLRCELQVGCTVTRNYTTPFMPDPTPAPVTTGLWSGGANGVAFQPFGPLQQIEIAVPFILFLGIASGTMVLVVLSRCLTACWRKCFQKSSEQYVSTAESSALWELIWTCIFIGASGGVLQCTGVFTTSTAFFSGILISSFAILAVASACNDVFLDSCWKRVIARSLRRKDGTCHGDNLRAASIDWIDITHRLLTLRLSGKESQTALSYVILRWSFVICSALVQQSLFVDGPIFEASQMLSWADDYTPVWENSNISTSMSTMRRPWWIAIAVLTHGCLMLLGLAISNVSPLSLLRGADQDSILLEAYKPYLEVVNNGSIASSSQVADYLDHITALSPQGSRPSLVVHHTPGRQIWIKFRGASFGLVLSLIGPLLLIPVTISYHNFLMPLGCVDTIVGDEYHHCKHSGNDTANMTRFVYVICYSVTGLGYTLLRDFITWTCTLESLTLSMTDRVKEMWTTVDDGNGRNRRWVKVPPFHGLNHLGDSSGVSLWSRGHYRLSRTRAGSLLALFGLQTLVIRIALIYAISGVAKVKHLDIELTLPMALWPMAFIWPVLYIPVLIWFLVPFQSPLGAQNGWRWAKIACDALNSEGMYGVVDGRARIATTSRAFEDEDLM